MRRLTLPPFMLICLALGAPSSPWGASARVAVGVGITGEPAAGGRFGASAFPLGATADGSGGGALFAARLSGGNASIALFAAVPNGPAVPLVMAGDQAPGGGTFVDFLSPRGCASYQAFWARLLPGDPSTPDASGIFRLGGNGLSVARPGEAAPGGGTFGALGAAPAVDAAGNVIFLAAWSAAADAGVALYRRLDDGTLERLLSSGDPAPGGGIVVSLDTPVLGCGGNLAVVADVDDGAGVRPALLAGDPALLQRRLAGGDPLPGGGHVIGLPAPPALSLNGELAVLVLDDLTGAAVARLNSGISMVARRGDPAPQGRTVDDLGPPTFLDDDTPAFRAVTAGGDGPADLVEMIVAAGSGSPALEALLTAGDPLPFGGHATIVGNPAGDGHGRVVTTVSTDSHETAVVAITATETDVVAISGRTVSAGAFLLDGGFRGTRPALRADGVMHFVAAMQGATTARALFSAAPGQAPVPLLAEGDDLVGLGVLQTLDGPPALTGSGTVLINASVGAPPMPVHLELADTSPPSIRLAAGDPSPLGGTFLTLGASLAGSADGRAAFTATLSGATATSGIFVEDAGGNVETVMARGEAAPGGGTYSAFGFAPARDDLGNTIFRAFTAGARTGSGVFRAAGSAATGQPLPAAVTIARSGDAAPGGGTYAALFDPVAASAGTVAFLADRADGTRGLYRESAGVVQLLLATGDIVPGGDTVSGLAVPAVDDSGMVSAIVDLTSAGDGAAVLRVGDGDIAVVVARDDALPGGAILRSFGGLVADGMDGLAGVVDLGGWSPGAAVMTFADDGDSDGAGDPIDCAPTDPGAFAVPPAVRGLTVSTAATSLVLDWQRAAAGAATVYDVVTGTLPSLTGALPYGDAACDDAGLSSTGTVRDIPAGEVWFLVRGRNTCGTGTSSAAGPGNSAPSPPRGALDALICFP